MFKLCSCNFSSQMHSLGNPWFFGGTTSLRTVILIYHLCDWNTFQVARVCILFSSEPLCVSYNKLLTRIFWYPGCKTKTKQNKQKHYDYYDEYLRACMFCAVDLL